MSYFNTIQGFADNNQAQQSHLTDMASSFASEKAQDFKEKYESVAQDLEKWGGGVQAVSQGWFLGRKIFKKMKSKTTGDEAGGGEKTIKQGGEKGDYEAGEGEDVEKGAMKFADKPMRNNDNPFNEEPNLNVDKSVDMSEELSAPATEVEDTAIRGVARTGLDTIKEEAPEVGEDASSLSADISSRADVLSQKLSDLNDSINKGISGKVKEPEAEPPKPPDTSPEATPPDTTPEPPSIEPPPTTETSTLDSVTTDAGEQLAKKTAVKAVEDQTTEAVGKSAVTSGLEIAGETALEAVPILGEIAGAGMLLGGLFKDLFGKHKEAVKSASIATGALTSGIGQSAGVDLSAVASHASNLGGLV